MTMTSSSQDDVAMPDADAANNASADVRATEETPRPMEVDASGDDALPPHAESQSQTESGHGKRRRAEAVAPAEGAAPDEAASGPEGRRAPKRVCRRPAGRASSDAAAGAARAAVDDSRAVPRQDPEASGEAPATEPGAKRAKQPRSQIPQRLDIDRTRRMPRLITPSPSLVTFPAPAPAPETDGVRSKDINTVGIHKSERPAAQESVRKQSSPELSATGKEPQKGDRVPPAVGTRPRSCALLRRLLPLFLVAGLVLLLSARFLGLPFATSLAGRLPPPIEPGSVYVPGAGFSGFWFTLGRLRGVPDPASRSYYCYSAGCLGVVATLSDRGRDEVLGLALEAQRLWRGGEIGRYDVVPRFVDGLLSLEHGDRIDAGEGEGGRASGASNATTQHLPIMTDARLLSKIHVITTRKRKGRGTVHHAVRTPATIHELREALVQTTWIPYVTGSGLWAEDGRTGDRHMDGGASAFGHPACAHHLGLPFTVDLFLNTLNVNLGRDKVEKFWDAGVAFGSEIGELNDLSG